MSDPILERDCDRPDVDTSQGVTRAIHYGTQHNERPEALKVESPLAS